MFDLLSSMLDLERAFNNKINYFVSIKVNGVIAFA